MECLDNLRQPLLNGHPPGVLADEGLGLDVAVVGDDDGGRVAPQPGDDQLADGARVAGELDGCGLADFGPVVGARPVQGHGLVVLAGQGVDLADEAG